jgi:hypothetical protein
MKNCLKVALLSIALLLTSVDAKATAVDEDKTTLATAWVDEWTKQMKIVEESIDAHDSMCGGKDIQMLLDLFIQKFREDLPKNLSQDDRSLLSHASIFALSVIDKKLLCHQKKLDALKTLENNL